MKARPTGFSLTEVVIALGIASFAMLAVVGLLPVAMDSTRNALNTTEAAALAERVIGDLRYSAERGENASGEFGFNLLGGAESAAALSRSGRAEQPSEADYMVTVTISPSPLASLSSNPPAHHATVRIFWPAAAKASNAEGNYEVATTVRLNPPS